MSLSEKARKSGFVLSGLEQIPALSKSDMILINTVDGLAELPAEVLGAVFSNTSLFETYNRTQLEYLNVTAITTTKRIKKYINSDITNEIFFEYIDGEFVIKYEEIIIVDGVPTTVQATDMGGRKLYWNDDPNTAIYYDGFPWKNENDDKIFISPEVSNFPVITYHYKEYEIKRCHIDINSGFPTIIDTYASMDLRTTGTITKNKDSFVFQLNDNTGKSCGIKVVVNTDGTLGGELIGEWVGINDIKPERRLTKDNVKEYLYTTQDYYTYISTMAVETSDKIGWYLLKDTKAHIYSKLDDGELTMYLAETKTNLAGSFVTEQAKNKFEQALYWNQDMTFGAGVTNEHIPVKNGTYTYMTTEITPYPVIIYQYNLTELCKFSYAKLPDNSYGIKQVFSGLSGNTATIYKDTYNMVLSYTDSATNKVSKVLLNKDGGTLIGQWLLKTLEAQTEAIDLSSKELPDWGSLKTDHWLNSNGTYLKWSQLPKELPDWKLLKVGSMLYSDGKSLTWKEVTHELPDWTTLTSDHWLKSDGKSLIWGTLPKELPTTLSGINKPYLSYNSKGVATWKEGYTSDTIVESTDTVISIDMTSDSESYVVKKEQGSLDIQILNLDKVPPDTTKIVKIILTALTGVTTLTWDRHIIATATEDLEPSSVGYTEFTLTYYSSLDTTNKPIFLKRLVYNHS